MSMHTDNTYTTANTPAPACHPLESDIVSPRRFTCPFHYVPHPLCRMAADEVCDYLSSRSDWQEELDRGKMLGVLIVESADGRRWFLAAYSGLLDGRNDHPYFVPPVFDAIQPNGYFKTHEAEITAINRRIDSLLHSPDYLSAMADARSVSAEGQEEIESYKRQMAEAKARRDSLRSSVKDMDAETLGKLERESQFMKAELRRIKVRIRQRQDEADSHVKVFDDEVESLRRQRAGMSDHLQHWLFEHYDMLDANGKRRNLLSIFAHTPQRIPPSGAGDCCAPKLLQYAYLHHLHPLCMAEFWWGQSPRGEIRQHGAFYPACRGKCLPILTHMMQGLDVDPYNVEHGVTQPLSVVFEDDDIVVVDKPSGMKSVPGRSDYPSVFSILASRYPQHPQLCLAHRLDMDTSGLLIMAKHRQAYLHLQRQFATHSIRKRYIALLSGEYHGAPTGIISLPLAADPLNRPYQHVDTVNGKEAVTEYRIMGTEDGHTRVCLYPKTGRTHQLRVHCAHAEGLGMPILGDSLYGIRSDRLYLHAEAITFIHPTTNKEMTLERNSPF